MHPVDLDSRDDCIDFKKTLLQTTDSCDNAPKFLVRIAIEELEAWFMGDQAAIKKAYKKCKKKQLSDYEQDSQSGTWELLADVVHPGGYNNLKKYGKRSRRILEEKVNWAKNISRHMNVELNKSPSFVCFRDGLRKFFEEK